ncbi:MAG: nucleotidyltransferase domain-containing protein, partial [Deltaproteobacteria bacterium]|nr:nucleotidyltransferase domain-containing protein [Deltaproteobacteria bacterium]
GFAADAVSSARLRSIAERCARSLRRREHCAVALTGSVARGDASVGSDIDLWVIGDRGGRQQLMLDGVRVTLLRDTLDGALEIDRLCRFEVDDLVVLADEDGSFARIREHFDGRRLLIRSLVLAETEVALLDELAAAADGPPIARALALGRAALLLAKVEVYFARGWRVPKWRNLAACMAPPLIRALRRLLHLPAGERAPRLDRALPGLIASLRRRRLPTGDPIALAVARQRLVGGLPDDGVVELRQLLGSAPRSWLTAARPTTGPHRCWLALHGLDTAIRDPDRRLRLNQRRFSRFVQSLPSLLWWQRRLPVRRLLAETGSGDRAGRAQRAGASARVAPRSRS